MNKQNASAVVITSWGYLGTRSPISAPQVAGSHTEPTATIQVKGVGRPAPVEVDDLVAMFEQTADDRKGMAKARRWLGKNLPERDKQTMKALRLQAGLSQKELADRIGLQQPNISAIEAGMRRPEYQTAQKLSRELNVTVDELYQAIDRQAGVAK